MSVWKKMSPTLQEEYGEEYRQKIVNNWNAALDRIGSTNINYVVDNYFHAITARFPRLRYQCGWDAILIWSPASYMPTPIQDWFLNLFVRGKRPIPAIIEKGGLCEKKTN
ncbi:hypothetical protein PFISCL1PPCAC_1492 [Pristionchus fissidentatus]|uniref:Uncharacterized protein n=1 Tax=Pristionchus fissidentatus TaxID=1538716 RepID=A0AAV5UVM5_9BILA|nr:hypothetical protein PFISCL1PPCAC_1492 [Pristionchus fissidentatus]